MVSDKEIEARAVTAFVRALSEPGAAVGDQKPAIANVNINYVVRAALEAAARVRKEDNAGVPVAWPKIMYVCENCQEYNPEMCGHDRRDIYVTPDGRWLCDSCIDEEGTSSRDCTTPPMLYAHSAPQPSGTVGVKPLKWDEHPAGGQQAIAAGLGLYRVHANGDDWYLVPDHMGKGGRVAAQADYERRILSALTAGKPEQPETVESVLLDAVRKIASTDLAGCANMTTAEIFGALSRMHETARVAVETAERILGRGGDA